MLIENSMKNNICYTIFKYEGGQDSIMLRITLFSILFFACAYTGAQQAERDTAEATDNLNLEPLRGMTYIDLTTEEDVFSQKGIKQKPKSNQYYFRVDRDIRYTKVTYFGDNLAEYVYDVDPAYQIMLSYRNCKMGFSGLFFGGLGLSALGAIVSLAGGEGISPILFVGFGFTLISWVPNYLAHDKIPEAVGIYNEKIGEHIVKENNSVQ